MVTRQQIIDEARTWLGTPFHHQGRLRGVGCDCVGLVIGVCTNLGLWPQGTNYTGYSRQPDPVRMGTLIHLHADEIPRDLATLADVYWMRFSREPRHLAIITDIGIIHSYADIGRVVEHGLDERWRKRIHKAYRLHGVVD